MNEQDDLKSSREQSQLLEAKIERLEVRCAGLEKEKDRVQIDLQDTRKRLVGGLYYSHEQFSCR
jgi:predicted  nucleic acid-binding Zn-ribbon protein